MANTSLLLNLPPEIRSIVWNYCLTSRSTLRIGPIRNNHSRNDEYGPQAASDQAGQVVAETPPRYWMLLLLSCFFLLLHFVVHVLYLSCYVSKMAPNIDKTLLLIRVTGIGCHMYYGQDILLRLCYHRAALRTSRNKHDALKIDITVLLLNRATNAEATRVLHLRPICLASTLSCANVPIPRINGKARYAFSAFKSLMRQSSDQLNTDSHSLDATFLRHSFQAVNLTIRYNHIGRPGTEHNVQIVFFDILRRRAQDGLDTHVIFEFDFTEVETPCFEAAQSFYSALSVMKSQTEADFEVWKEPRFIYSQDLPLGLAGLTMEVRCLARGVGRRRPSKMGEGEMRANTDHSTARPWMY